MSPHLFLLTESAPWAWARTAAATWLRHASALLDAAAARLAAAPSSESLHPLPRVEFHAESGAPEGALYVDGRFVGWLPGVTRL